MRLFVVVVDQGDQIDFGPGGQLVEQMIRANPIAAVGGIRQAVGEKENPHVTTRGLKAFLSDVVSIADTMTGKLALVGANFASSIRLTSVSSMRTYAKVAAFCTATVCVLPALLSYWIRSGIFGRNRALEGSTQALALWPGMLGECLRKAFLGRVLAHCHWSATIAFGTIFSKADASIAENVVIGPRCHIGLVRFEKDVLVGPGCHLPSGARTHGTGKAGVAIRDQPVLVTQITVGQGAWIGSGAIIMADVGADSVIAAGSVVNEPIPPGVVAGGVPARVLRRRPAPRAPDSSVASAPVE